MISPTLSGKWNPTRFIGKLVGRLGLALADGGEKPRPQGTSNPGPPDKKLAYNSINHNNLQQRTALNNKNRGNLRAAQITSECGALLSINGVC